MNDENTYKFYLIANNTQTSKNITFSLHSSIFFQVYYYNFFIISILFHKVPHMQAPETDTCHRGGLEACQSKLKHLL